jgi:hypothetical protein
MNGDITLAGVTLTLAEWEELDSEARELLLAVALGVDDDGPLPEIERGLDVAAMVDLLAPRPN